MMEPGATLPVLAVLAMLLLLAERWWPYAPAQWQRWPGNLSLGIVSLAIARLFAMAGPLAAALWAQQQGWGVLNLIAAPAWLAIVFSIVAMDLAVWVQHWAFHRFDWLWRWHRLHHADQAIDLSTGVRFHPVEAVLSLGWKSLATVLLGVPPIAVPLFEMWLTGGSLIEHANLRMPLRIDRVARRFWVTPAMHRVHHSAHGDDASYNLGFALAIWDRLFGTYRPQPSGPRIGLAAMQR